MVRRDAPYKRRGKKSLGKDGGFITRPTKKAETKRWWVETYGERLVFDGVGLVGVLI
jgi:hypothetical protein